MSSDPPSAPPVSAAAVQRRGLSSYLKPFPILHAGNAGVNMIYALGQTLVFARSLDKALFAQTIAMVTISLYVLPINQAVARANFVVVRRQVVAGNGAHDLPEVGLAFHLSQALMILSALLAPMITHTASLGAYLILAAFAGFNTLTNLWSFELQMVMLAVERPLAFEIASLLRRAANIITLTWLWFSHDFNLFVLLVFAHAVLFQVWLMRYAARSGELFAWPAHLSRAALAAHAHQLWTSAQATFAEWLTLNGPYALFTLRFGVGGGLIVLDTGMKLLRIGLTATRNFSEIALPTVSRAVLEKRGAAATRAVIMVLAVSCAPVLLLAAVMVFREHWLFNVLLSHNNVMPAGSGLIFAVALLAGVGFQAGSHLVGHVGRPSDIRLFTLGAATSFACVAIYILGFHPDMNGALWAVSLGVVGAAASGLSTIVRTLRAAR